MCAISKLAKQHISTLSDARVLGFEPRLKVLETSVLPLYYTRRKLKAIPCYRNSF